MTKNWNPLLGNKRELHAVDLYCGGGGTTSGLVDACDELGVELHLTAINHWAQAIDTHKKNHPYVTHLCESLDNVDPLKVVPGGYLDILVASPECIFFSNARGGKPINDQRRSGAWRIQDWASALRIDNILIENVPELQNWAPLGADGRPLKSKKGEIFLAYIASLQALNYTVEYRVLVTADYGDPTTRRRLFIMARRGNKRISWPAATHTKNPQPTLFGEMLKPWTPARDIIDWTIPSKSIFDRKKPLAATTLKRVEAGIKKFVKPPFQEAFLVVLRQHMDAQSLDAPIPTLTGGGSHMAICQTQIGGEFLIKTGGPMGSARQPQSVTSPLKTVLTEDHTALVEPSMMEFIVPQFNGSRPQSVNETLGTLTTTSRGVRLVEPIAEDLTEPFMMLLNRKQDPILSCDSPLPTITATSSDFAVVEAHLAQLNHGIGDIRLRSLDQPLNTITSEDATVLIEPFLTEVNHADLNAARRVQCLDDPIGTLTARGNQALVETVLMTVGHGDKGGSCASRVRSLDEPLPTQPGSNAFGLVDFITKYNGTGGAISVEEPLDTVTGRDRFALVQVDGRYYKLGIRLRMLHPRELAAAMSFWPDYQFTGTREQTVKMIGNAVPRLTAKALCLSLLEPHINNGKHSHSFTDVGCLTQEAGQLGQNLPAAAGASLRRRHSVLGSKVSVRTPRRNASPGNQNKAARTLRKSS